MTKVTFKITKDDFIVEADGHATGSPEVCSGISAVMQGALWYLAEYEDSFASVNKDGYLKLSFLRNDRTNVLYKVLYSSILGIQNGYPEYVKIVDI